MGSRGPYAHNNDAHHQERPRYLRRPECFRALKSGAVPILHAPLLLRLGPADMAPSFYFSPNESNRTSTSDSTKVGRYLHERCQRPAS